MDILSDVSVIGKLTANEVATGQITGKDLHFKQTGLIEIDNADCLSIYSREISIWNNDVFNLYSHKPTINGRAIAGRIFVKKAIPESCSKFLLIDGIYLYGSNFTNFPISAPAVSAWKSIDWDDSTHTGSFSKVEIDYEYGVCYAEDYTDLNYRVSCVSVIGKKEASPSSEIKILYFGIYI